MCKVMEKHRYGLMFPGRSRSCPVFSLAVAGFSLLCGSLGYGRLVRGGPAFMSVFRKHCAATARGYAAVVGEGGAYSGKDRDRARKNGAYPCARLYRRQSLYGNGQGAIQPRSPGTLCGTPHGRLRELKCPAACEDHICMARVKAGG